MAWRTTWELAGKERGDKNKGCPLERINFYASLLIFSKQSMNIKRFRSEGERESKRKKQQWCGLCVPWSTTWRTPSSPTLAFLGSSSWRSRRCVLLLSPLCFCMGGIFLPFPAHRPTLPGHSPLLSSRTFQIKWPASWPVRSLSSTTQGVCAFLFFCSFLLCLVESPSSQGTRAWKASKEGGGKGVCVLVCASVQGITRE